ncbi:hypothetical protein FA15DRAFT_682923 [Coprinopsis marcescibilis]|uniref:Fruit-body specific protein a n=1 Tax=Coprinopsis marcescibilis TaxID=230819 RepID=A0A5C3KUG8_COPMA|nr:hypothetical protein FA15DRAFT_682923 [Coprinopsis marcescibilis]
MLIFSRLCTLATLAALVSGAVIVRQEESKVTSPSAHGTPHSIEGSHPDDGRTTDSGAIAEAARTVDQKSGPGVDELANQPVPETVTILVDGQTTGRKGGPRRNRPGRGRRVQVRAPGDYVEVFPGTGTGPTDRDASVSGTAYLTYTLVSNATYNIDACLNFCDTVTGCVFVNLYYEFNNYGLDFEASEQSNLKCAAYGDIHTAVEKTNFGGQQSYPAPAPVIYIQHSSGYVLKDLVDPDVPEGYEYVFGPIGGATSAPGYMGFAFLDRYDVDACAHECNQRGADPAGGSCQFFNIWRAVVDGIPTTYSCVFYYIPTDATTATNTGQGNLAVTLSRGYRRINYVIDGGFEGFPCGGSFCYAESYANWIGTSSPGGLEDALIFYNTGYARTGHGSGLLGSGGGYDALPGTLTPAEPLETVSGKQYKIELFQTSSFSGPVLSAPAWFDVLWNGNVVLEVRPGYSPWSLYSVVVTATGDDVLAFHGGQAPAWTFLDDIAVWLMY